MCRSEKRTISARSIVEIRERHLRVAAHDREDVVAEPRELRRSKTGDARELTALLTEDVGFWSDGGGKVLAARRPIFGRDNVVQVLVGIRRTAPSMGIALDDVTMEVVEVNHEPALVFRVAGQIDSVYTLSLEGDAIAAIRIVRNPDKLRFLDRQLLSSRE